MKEKLFKYFETRDSKLREELVKDNEDLVSTIALTYSKKLGLVTRELKSFGFEGLLVAIDNYNPNLDVEFSTYAYKFIKGYILRGIPQLQGTKFNEFYRNFIKYKVQMEDKKSSYIKEDITIIDDILNKMIEDGKISKGNFFYYKEQLLLNNLLFFEDLEEEIVDNQHLYDNINNEYLKEIVKKYLDVLNEKQRLVIEYRFGLNGKPKKTLVEIGTIIGHTHEGVRLIEKRAFELMKRYSLINNEKYPEIINDENNGPKGRRFG